MVFQIKFRLCKNCFGIIIQSIEKGQWEVSSALGFSRKQQLRHIILPQAVRRILRAKFRLGLFENPYADEATTQDVLDTPAHRETARLAAERLARMDVEKR